MFYLSYVYFLLPENPENLLDFNFFFTKTYLIKNYKNKTEFSAYLSGFAYELCLVFKRNTNRADKKRERPSSSSSFRSFQFKLEMELELGFKTEDLIKDLRVTRKEIDELQKRLKNDGYNNLTDQQIVQFLLTCDNNVELAKSTVKNHFKLRSTYGEFFDGRDFQKADLHNIINVL